VDELELRIAGHELALIEVVAHIDREHIVSGMQAIRDGLVDDVSEDEGVIREQALGMLDDALRRYDPPAGGQFLQAVNPAL
jgi:ClpP class serine protease